MLTRLLRSMLAMALSEDKGDILGPCGEALLLVAGYRERWARGSTLVRRDICKVCELLGAGEIMLNCIDMDGQVRASTWRY